MLSTAYLLVMSLIAGILTGIIGMASLTLYPVLLSVGVLPVSANATITIATVGAGTTISSLKELKHHWGSAVLVAILSTCGSVCGALILTRSSNAGFQKIVPVFILLAGVLLLWPASKQGRQQSLRFAWFLDWAGVILIGLYNGYFGAASGLLMIAVLSKAIGGEYTTYNAVRNFASLVNNICSAVIFICTIRIQWSIIGFLLFGLLVGGYLGPIIVRYIPSTMIKKTVGVIAILLAMVLAWQAAH
ncbi:sulfite exporter TauE/SafE family protein [Limosilactobacillus kribbianus]|uniref:sulfite exporter TauE/SafE family protein n=1 Tax=Limosilactobacillus kribbianus TaxID=2982695 RepID=UPI0022651BB0|nr:sulfite exporter TauE/SafE family protein [Limosilactobacillus kribbianus]